MATSTHPNQIITVNQTGKKLRVDDVITNITPYDVPFQSSIGSDTTNEVIFSWLEDKLRDVSDNAKQEGADATDSAQTQPVTRQNTTQILSETFNISRTANKIGLYGRTRDYARLTVNVGRALKRDLENAYVGTGQVSALDDGNGNRRLGGAQSMIDSSMVITAGGTGATAKAALTEDLVLDACQAVFEAGTEASIIMIKVADARKVADFAYTIPGATSDSGGYRNRDMGQGTKLVNAVDVYQSSYGTQKVVLNRFIRDTDCLVFDPEYWQKVTFDPWQTVQLAKTGDAQRTMIVGEYSLKHRNFKASALITNLS